MHILRNSQPLPLPYSQQLQPGEWLVQDDTAFMCAVGAGRGTVSLEKWTDRSVWSLLLRGDQPDSDCLAVKSILLIRSGAIGDLLLLSPCIEKLQAKYPDAKILIACYQKHWPIATGFCWETTEYPVPAEDLNSFDLIIPLENIIELATEKGIHATDAFAEALGVTVTDYKPVYHLSQDELINHVMGFVRGNKPRVALQLHASSVVRNYPIRQWGSVMSGLLNRGWEIMLLGDKDSIPGAPSDVHDCSKLSFREAAAVLATCDVFCGVDSAFFNLCPALGVPAIGLFGPVDWRTRVKEGSGQLALAGVGECAPCGWTNSRAGQQWPSGMPCQKAGTCVPLAEIAPARVIAKIDAYRK